VVPVGTIAIAVGKRVALPKRPALSDLDGRRMVLVFTDGNDDPDLGNT
jgi:hypothetical protein